MEEANLPTEMIVLILTFLPVKSLIRFTCVSKRFHSLILSDPKFAQSQLQAARHRNTLTRRLLFSYSVQDSDPKIESVDFESQSSARKPTLPFQPPATEVKLLGSCNGIVFLAFDAEIFYMWNPSTGFFKALPDPSFSTNDNRLLFFGVGYLPATEDYVAFVFSMDCSVNKNETGLYSSRSHAWKTLEVHVDASIFETTYGILLKEALHWLCFENEILAFDLGQEEEKYKFRKMLPPQDFNDDGVDSYLNSLGVSAGGCLSLVRYLQSFADCIHVWVMGEYDVRDSWTKLYKFKLSDPPKEPWSYTRLLVLETFMAACISSWVDEDPKIGIIRILQKENKCSISMTEGDWPTMIHYEESLVRIED